ncbi:type III secretion system cytoplasmic ring protein SctQ [Mailhella sp.]|uniref:type III secretion system cytoplasmic ring protein SctQ n=1 Tax=Mailhella sp. TaxID=1981029 RepID=UPI004062A4CA
MPATILPFKAPRLAPEKAHLLNRLCQREPSWRTPFGLGEADWEMLADVPPFPAACAVPLTVGLHRWIVRFSDASFLMRHPAFGADGPSFDVEELPQEVRSAVIGALLAPVIDALQSALGVPVSADAVVLAPASVSPSPCTLGMKVKLTGCSTQADQSLFLSIMPESPEAAPALAELLGRLPLPSAVRSCPGLAALPLELAFESGYLRLKLNDTKALERGDVLIPEVWHSAEGRLMLRLCRGHAPALSAPCTFAGGRAVLEAPLAPEVEPVMDSEHNDIDIRLNFELDRTVITLGELSSLAPGYVFTLGCDAQTPVTVRANGKAIARGRLVDMDGTLGVQISETL